MKILAIDTSGLVASVAISDGDILLGQFSIQYKTTHSEILMPMLDDLCKKVNLDLKSIDAIAVAKGPGSFTGLRIGSATVKGLALALDKPVIAIPTVDGIAYNLYGNEKVICPMMDARRGQVYTGLYTFVPANPEGKIQERRFDMQIIHKQFATSVDEIAEMINEIGKPAILLGDGVPVYRDKLENLLKVPYSIAPMHQNRQSAAALLPLAMQYLEEGKTMSSDEFAPDYLRLSQAEREASEGKENAPKKKEPKTPGIIRVRPMTAEDLDDAAALEKANLGKEAWNSKQLLDALTRDDTIYVVAEKAGRIVGLCGVQNISGEGEITNVSVAPDCRNEGTGYKMVKQLLERGRGIGIEAYTLEVRAANAPARRLYEKLGFVSEGVRAGFYEDPKDDAVIYWKRN
ncbi:bifunctional tRNA (adenosine(37)-N6)-threonylcarbamoyltransferase complex dimerization subunit type 1 TsaB/ribosomal protein alanine acetyltransferase RimI [Butyrivibrio proteoclasticus]|uniref:bifunctional tRNA (adenosine(37)-N6)-threonylcarbamoyltransferase complex dimerization subunit type 1 TsaB/ribosomal protein alanine acetyltransferase RimI n=1 Tax=Butyrivibrio proteoclasticus TaxID=43305 RepID=UPI00047B59F2|nr:bifunctional tRNA (adenosine(37)-N6)-threonylcarbamoyltransferase complex dimerization subunit type 1 TsaB/ribosomal protein alanine acetyltransferase RimI [Butyrivibrio proteoclasticus]